MPYKARKFKTPSAQVAVYMPVDLANAVTEAADEDEVSRSEWINEVCRRELERRGRLPQPVGAEGGEC